jgi:uncharacterized protein with HEPN domain
VPSGRGARLLLPLWINSQGHGGRQASRHLGRELKSQHKDVRWKDIAGIGNILRHEYQRVDGQIIWNAVKDDLPTLKKALLTIDASLEE